MNRSGTQVLEAANAAITKGDYEGFLAFCTDDTRWDFVGDRLLEGKAAVREWMSTAYAQPPRFDVSQFIASGEDVVAIGEITITDVAGVQTRHDYCDVWHLRDGRLASLRAFVVMKPSKP